MIWIFMGEHPWVTLLFVLLAAKALDVIKVLARGYPTCTEDREE